MKIRKYINNFCVFLRIRDPIPCHIPYCIRSVGTLIANCVLGNKNNVSVNNTALYFVYNKNIILSGRHVSAFIRSSSGPLEKQIQELSVFQCIVGSQMLTDCVI
jgi:hypothetical protein